MVREQKCPICSWKDRDRAICEQNYRFCSWETFVGDSADQPLAAGVAGVKGKRGEQGSADQPLAAGEEGDEFRGEGAAEVGQESDEGDGEPDGDYRGGSVAADDQGGDGHQEENVHQVHAEGEFGEGGDQGGGFLLTDAGEHQEEAEGGEQHIGGAELPGPFYDRRGDDFSRNGFHPEGPAGKDGSDDET